MFIQTKHCVLKDYEDHEVYYIIIQQVFKISLSKRS